MTNFEEWQREAAAHGGFRCEICYGFRTVEAAFVDADGQRWTVCRGRCAAEAGMVEPGPQHNHINEGVYGGCPACGTVLSELAAEAEAGYCPQCRMPEPRHKMDCSERGKQDAGGAGDQAVT